MKINEKNLCAFATSATPIDREGWLSKRGDVNKAFQKRWFVLKGNLLFYFDKKGDKEPVGVVILEGCTIELAEDEELFSFKIVFQCEGGRSYTLCAESQSSMEAWMKALACAGYDYMKLMVAELQRQLNEAEEAATNTNTPLAEEPKVPPRGLRYNPFNRTQENNMGKTVPGSRHRQGGAKIHYGQSVRPDARGVSDSHGLKTP
ncbi:Sesquipedalian-1 [Eumeta japonica]|uniref:Sesquipedalian-1 n=1 Tax=Eumeta variegata TaxID=151549 RepID=A0A4C1TTA0_EUMVA|nr:Sesquipedalian-1 [Eumeta japonica]